MDLHLELTDLPVKGDIVSEVVRLQTILAELGYNIGNSGIDGKFGNDTQTALDKFLETGKIAVGGNIGEKTLEILKRQNSAILDVPTNSQNIKFPPTPQEDEINGTNDNCYLTAIGHPTELEKREFVASLKPFIYQIGEEKNLPKKTILAMAVLECGYGFTRIGYYANNLFGLKKFTTDTVNSYALTGQPAETDTAGIRILRQTINGGLIFDETIRTNNRYEKFNTRKDCILFLVDIFFQKPRYKPALDKFRRNLANGIPENEANLQFAFEIAKAGYNHLGGDYYRNAVGGIISRLEL
jgi:hypothetical protein